MRVKKLLILLAPYLISLSITTIALFLSLFIFSWLGKINIFLIFLPAIMVSTWYAGIRAGLFANILSTVAIYYFFTIPVASFEIKSFVTVTELLSFIIEGVIISYFIDSGHRHQKLENYKKREKEQKEIIEQLKQKLENAKQQTALRDEFLAIASHELKTPLTTVVLQIQTTLHNIRNVSLSEFSVEHLLRMLQSMQNQTKRLSKMINDLLNISLITTHKMELELEDVDLATLINDIAQGFAEKFEKEHVVLTVSIKDTVFGRWDRLRLEQVLDNLISNSLKYGNKKPVIIELEKQDGFGVVRVIDKGIGIVATDQRDIFSLFKRGTTEKDYKGLGIGLYIAQQIIALHGGSIDVKSKPNHGSIFTIALPIIK